MVRQWRVPSPPPASVATPPRPTIPEPRVAFTGNFTRVEDVFDGYTLGAGDRVRLDYLSAPEYNNETLVLGDGTLNLPLIGKIAVRGMTPEQAASAITAKYGYYIREPLVTLTLVQPRPVRVAISGEINRPGSYSVSLRDSGQFPSVSQIIEQAGGITQTANLREVLVRRPRESGAPQIISLNLMSMVSGAAVDEDLPLRDGDSIFIPTSTYTNPEEATQIATSSLAGATPQSLTIAVIGEVVRPGTHTVTTENGGPNPGAKAFPTITKALQIAGGITQSADLRRVEIRRPTRTGSITVIPIDLAQLLAAGDLRQDAILQQGDTIVIPTNPNPSQADTALIATASFAAATPQSLKIAVVGEVARPGTHTVTPEGTGADGVISFPTVTQALKVAGGITQAADLRGVFIRRPNRSGGEQLIAVDLWQLLQGGDLRQDAILQQGDTIVIPTNPNPNPAASALIASASFAADAATPLNIAVVGEVIRPGTYTVTGQAGAGSEDGAGGFPTVTKALQVAGGITPSADIRSVQVRRFTKNGSEQIIAVNLWELLQSGDLRQDIILQQGDTIMIPTAQTLTAAEATELAAVTFSPNQIRVNVVGEVFKPGEVQVPPNSPLNQALLAAGGFTNRSSKGEVELIRLNPNGTVSRRKIEVDFSGGINEATNPILLNNDAIVVDRSGFTKFTDGVGKVAQPVGGLLGIFNIFRILGF
ncbi:SLBB domain-containing protein [[Phormidium] sp. ETS-05]|uniref:SLBB domain-containing protein n=1 Tax=[Phormidium] sp. ETS-05 TaxID=222819 RepID=UPI001E475D31|nr:SLBB domain-containing protein [[Phormidium] sp. ETS-05]